MRNGEWGMGNGESIGVLYAPNPFGAYRTPIDYREMGNWKIGNSGQRYNHFTVTTQLLVSKSEQS